MRKTAYLANLRCACLFINSIGYAFSLSVCFIDVHESFSKFVQIYVPVISEFLVNIAIKIVLFLAGVFDNNQEMRKEMTV